MKMQQEKLLQIVESYLNIISNEVDEKKYRKFIETTPKLKEYDDLMFSISENQISYKLLEEVYEIVKNKVKCLDESRS